jgi:CRISPR/Cas system CMR subunit Cmr6 (Cas7 group RAMP superfamily)
LGFGGTETPCGAATGASGGGVLVYRVGVRLLKTALQEQGIGGKVAAGYGYFVEDEQQQKGLHKRQQSLQQQSLPMEDRFRLEISSWKEEKLVESFGRDFNKTAKEYDGDFKILLKVVKEVYGELIESWREQPKGSNKLKAYKKLRGGVPDE